MQRSSGSVARPVGPVERLGPGSNPVMFHRGPAVLQRQPVAGVAPPPVVVAPVVVHVVAPAGRRGSGGRGGRGQVAEVWRTIGVKIRVFVVVVVVAVDARVWGFSVAVSVVAAAVVVVVVAVAGGVGGVVGVRGVVSRLIPTGLVSVLTAWVVRMTWVKFVMTPAVDVSCGASLRVTVFL